MKLTKLLRFLLIAVAAVMIVTLFACTEANEGDISTEEIVESGEDDGNAPGESNTPDEPADSEDTPCTHENTTINDECEKVCDACSTVIETGLHTKGEPDAEDHCNVKCTNCGTVMEENKHGATVKDSGCYDACEICGDRFSEKPKHTKGSADPEDHCNVKCTNCETVLAEGRHGETVVNDKCEQVCEACGDLMSSVLSHLTPAEDAWTFDPKNPQNETAPCPRCQGVQSRDASKTTAGLTLFGPDALAALVHNVRIDLTVETDENGIRYCRATTIQEGEGTITLNDGNAALMGVGKYVAMLARRHGASGGTDVWINSAGKTDHVGAKTVTVVMAATGNWDLVIYDFSTASQISAENGVGWTRFDINPPSAVGEYTDIAYIGFFNSKEEAYAYYGSYLGAYLGADTCAHTVDNVWKPTEDGKIGMTCNVCYNVVNVMECTHFDLSKLSNITAKTEAGTVYFTADCALCGATGADVPSLNQEQGKVLTPSELNALAYVQASLGLESNGAYGRYSAEYITDDGEVPYVRFVSKIAHENCLLINDGTSALLGVNKYIAVLYRSSGRSTSMEAFVTAAGTLSPVGFTNKTVATVADGTWRLAIIDMSSASQIDTVNGTGWTRLDVINSPAEIGDTIDIAYVGFFSSTEKANEYYLAYLNAYLGIDNCCHSYATDWEGTGEPGKMQNDCIICGKTVVTDCEHVSDGNWTKTENEGEIKSTCTLCNAEFAVACEHADRTYSDDSTPFEYNFVCNHCGFVADKDGVNSYDGLAIYSPEDIIGVSTKTEGKYSDVANGAYSYTLLEDPAGFKYAHHEVIRDSKGEVFLYLNTISDEAISETGPYFAMLVRRSSGIPNNTDLFISATGALSNDNVFYGKFTQIGEWELVIFDYSACKGWNYTDGAATIRFDILNGSGIKVGEYVDIAYAGFFASDDNARAFYDQFAAEYGLN